MMILYTVYKAFTQNRGFAVSWCYFSILGSSLSWVRKGHGIQLVEVLNCIRENVDTKLVRSTISILGKSFRTPGWASLTYPDPIRVWIHETKFKGEPCGGLCYPPHSPYLRGAWTGEAYVCAYGKFS